MRKTNAKKFVEQAGMLAVVGIAGVISPMETVAASQVRSGEISR
ncbi:hypothetical protein [Sedimenticola hydrogenitrophicus]|nr:hypothetical protein [Sedimenticola hydrogenitrophicus]